MNRLMRAMCALCVVALSFVASACVAEPTTNTANSNPNTTNAAPPAPANPPATLGAGEARVPVTLPVLDAFFHDEAFAGELKSKLQLTDEQVERLRTVAREETASLRESEGDAHSGSTAAAAERAAEQIRGVIGEEKAQQLATLVRERWRGGEPAGAGGAAANGLPSKPNSVPTDTRVVVNAPAYRMDVFEDGKLVKSYKVGIGYPEFPLPTGLRKADTIIFNPTWTPPDEPWVESSTKVKPGEKIEAGSKLNPLGLLKIPIGLPSLIHGGKSPAKLGTFASHGCVGLTNPLAQDFAQLLAEVGGAEITKEQIAAYAKKRDETKTVKLSRPVPVELRYETIVVEDGKLRIFRDVYDRGTNTEENLRAVLEAHGVSLDQLSEQERAQVSTALKEMARDATGKPADGTPSATPSPDAAAKNANRKRGAGAQEERVTRATKGKKEITIELAALAGKGYPPPVGMPGADAEDGGKGQQKKKTTSSSAATAGKRG